MSATILSEKPIGSQPDPVVRLENSQTRAARLVQVMRRAFFNDPTFVYISPDESARIKKRCAS